MDIDNDKNNPNEKKTLLAGTVSLITIAATILHTTIGFFVYQLWTFVWSKLRIKKDN